MRTDLPKVESATLQPSNPDPSCQQARAPEKHTAMAAQLPTPTEGATRREVGAARGGADRRFGAETPVDLVQEGANMLALQMRQSHCVTPLSLSSKATQAVLRQF